MPSLDHVMSALGGVAALAVGVHTIVTRRVDVGEDEEFWLYGWRAVVIGCVVVLAGLILFASAV